MAEEEEFVHSTLPEVFVYKIPPKASAAGHKASDWKEQVWVGKLQISTKGDTCLIKLIGEDGKMFALARVRKDSPSPVEKVSDSSRYFVLRIENAAGAYAFIGIGFNNRSDAFDFNVALQDAQKEVDDSKRAKLDLGPAADFSLKAGEKITISVNVDHKGPTKPRATGGGGGGGTLPGISASRLAPPPGAGTTVAAPPRVAAAPARGGGDDLLGLGAALGTVTISGAGASVKPAPAPAPAAADWEPF